MTTKGPIRQQGAIAAGNLLAMVSDNVAKDSGHAMGSLPTVPVPIAQGGTAATDVATARGNLGLGSAAVQNIGTSGANVPLLNGVNTWGATQAYSVSGGTCIQLMDSGCTLGVNAGGVCFHAYDVGDSLGYYRTSDQLKLSIATRVVAQFSNGRTDLIKPDDGAINLVVSGPSKAVRIGTANDGSAAQIDGVDNTGSASYQPLSINGSSVLISAPVPGGKLSFSVQGNERAQIASDVGFFKAANAANFYNTGGFYHELASNAAGIPLAVFSHTHTGNPRGPTFQYLSSPNNPGNYFITCSDNVTDRFYVMANGGVMNYSANNINLSDARLKEKVHTYSDKDLDGLEAAFTSVDWGRWKYKDQTHNDWNHGYTAQAVEKAFADVAPELVEDIDERKMVYDSDLTHIGLALLSRALKRIAELEALLKEKKGGKLWRGR